MINITGEKAASSETYITVNLLSDDGNGGYTIRTGRGRYLDQWSRVKGRWAIRHRQFILDFVVIHPVTVNLGWSYRDRDDPSYQLLGELGSA